MSDLYKKLAFPDPWGSSSDISPSLFMDPSEPGTVPLRAEEKKSPQYKYSVKYKVFHIDYEADRTEIENIMSEILNGNLMLLYEERTFTKDGTFIIALKWAEVYEKEPDIDEDAADE